MKNDFQHFLQKLFHWKTVLSWESIFWQKYAYSLDSYILLYLFSLLCWNECNCAAKTVWHAWHRLAKRVVTVNHYRHSSLLTCFTVNQHVCGFKGTPGEWRAQSAARPAKMAEYITHYAQIQASQRLINRQSLKLEMGNVGCWEFNREKNDSSKK